MGIVQLCIGLRFHCYFSRLSVLAILFGLTLSSQFEIKEISELVDNEDNTKKYFLEKHDIVRRAAGTVQPNIPLVSPSGSLAIPSKPVTTRMSSSSLKQLASPTKLGASSASIIPSSTIIPMFTSTVNVPTTFPPTTLKKPTNSTAQHKTTSKGTTTSVGGQTTAIPSEPTAKYITDEHKYYKSQYYKNGKQWWFNLDDASKKPTLHSELSKNIMFSDLLRTSFTFPYYGHLVNNVTITNKGYVFLGERLHKFNASAQYAAPLMADFVADLHEKTSIRYIDTGDRLTVEWANMRVRGEPKDIQFSFQCSILKNGTLIFAYKNIPKPVDQLKKNKFFVRVGLSDTYRRERIVYGYHRINNKYYRAVRLITYYLYDRVELPKNKVAGGAAFVIIPFPNCVMFNSCDTCLNTQTKFDCSWCPKINRCSDGVDRHRAKWETAGCLDNSLKSCSKDSSGLSGGEIAVIVIILLLAIAVLAWFVYAYSHPQTKSGLCLIQYGNPTKWCRNSSGETQNTSTDGRISFKTMSFESNA